ncbi:hypothetical protein P9112_010559 [Eukaryota sp. TZLM1-RC]
MNNPIVLRVDNDFQSMKVIRQTIQLFESQTRKKLLRRRSDKHNITLCCLQVGCNFALLASTKKPSSTVVIRVYQDHDCIEDLSQPKKTVVPTAEVLSHSPDLERAIVETPLLLTSYF